MPKYPARSPRSGVQPETGDIQLLRSCRRIESREHAGDLVRMLPVDLAAVVVFVKAAKAAMSNAPNHKSFYQ